MGGQVAYAVSDGVATVRLSRPEAMNSLDVPTKEELLARVLEAGSDDAVRCVVLTGTGRAFCVGQDLKEHAAVLEQGASGGLSSTVETHYNPLVEALATMPKPVVAALNGVAAGAGASLAFAADVRVLAASASINLAFAAIGLSCDTGASWTLPRLVGRAAALELLYFPRTIPAEEALSLGLATRVVPDEDLDATVAELATRLASGPTLAYGAIRRSVTHSAGAELRDALAFESQMMTLTGATEDHRDAVSSFLAKERPTFHGR